MTLLSGRFARLFLLLIAVPSTLWLGACAGTADDDDSVEPIVDGALAWIVATIESSEPEAVLDGIDHVTVVLQPGAPLVDADGNAYGPGVVEGSDPEIEFGDWIPNDNGVLEVVFRLDTEGFAGEFPTLGFDPGANVPMTFRLQALGFLGNEDIPIATSPLTASFTVERDDTLEVVIADFELVDDPTETPTCDDDLDNDADGWTDLDDPICVSPDGEEDDGFGSTECNDGFDNDEDLLVDSVDPDCTAADVDSEGIIPVSTCEDGLDNDGDGWIDAADPACDTPDDEEDDGLGAPECNNGLDDDLDGFVDSDDPDCGSAQDDGENTPVLGCENGQDDDGDGWTDAEDPDCLAGSDETGFGPTDCNDGLDNDGDGFSDSTDPDCVSAQQDSEDPLPCFDFLDNDGDGWIDAADPDCAVGINETGLIGGACNDGLDNDGDGFVDAEDTGCQDALDTEELNACDDGLDNDGDGWTDLDDAGCADADGDDETDDGSTQCNDEIDNDGDGDIDEADANCLTGADDAEGPECDDGVDNDGDGWTDLLDGACVDPTDDAEAELMPTACSDGLDNDFDGFIDSLDPQCDDGADPSEDPACVDTFDNDGDGWVDFADPGCADALDDTEGGLANLGECSDGVDNDTDGDVDGADVDCTDAADDSETPLCSDGLDNDGDGWVDLDDPGCNNDPLTDAEVSVPASECNDLLDNDSDGLIDSDDPECDDGFDDGEDPACDDQSDNDGDGWVDLDDPGCALDPAGEDEGGLSATQCNDGTDNDTDGNVDADDADCTDGFDDNESTVACNNGADDDGDGWVDLADPGCGLDPSGLDEGGIGTTECNDGINNEPLGPTNDFLADSLDPDCTDGFDDNEGLAACGNGVDDDADGWVDLGDPGCEGDTQDEDEGGFSTFACNDNADNDADGLVDSADPECVDAFSPDEGGDPCADSVDNDLDGWTDTADPDCSVLGREAGFDASVQCNDGADNDGDGLIDSADPECDDALDGDEAAAAPDDCADGTDNDFDGWVDAMDPDCSESPFDEDGLGTTECNDGVDNDGDSQVDVTDTNCVDGLDDFEAEETCANGVDDDGDGWQDADDPDCIDGLAEVGLGATECNDGIDNDGDGFSDSNDPECDTAQDGDESSPADDDCADGIDNDNDGWVDDADPDCDVSPFDELGFSSLECNDGVDNDGDGDLDGADGQCDDALDDSEAAACDNGADDDGDGWADGDDPGCAGDPGGDSEGGFGSGECNDGIDNDNSGDADAADSSCDSAFDPTEDGVLSGDDDDSAAGDDDDSAVGDDDDSALPGDDDDSALPGDDDDSALPGDDDDSAAQSWFEGDFVITEILSDPNGVDADLEWFEVFNATAGALDLNGFLISDNGTDSHTISTSVVVPAGGYAVLGRSMDPVANGGAGVDYAYGADVTLDNGPDEVILTAPDNTEVDRVEYDGGPNFPAFEGAAQNLEPNQIDPIANNDGANWCPSDASFFGANNDKGTPGADNTLCGPVGDDDDSALPGDDDDSALPGDDDDSALPGDDDDSALPGDDDDSAGPSAQFLIDGDVADLAAFGPALAVSAADGPGNGVPADFGLDGTVTELYARIFDTDNDGTNDTLVVGVRGDFFGAGGGANGTYVLLDVAPGTSQGVANANTPGDNLNDAAGLLDSDITELGVSSDARLLLGGIGWDAALGVSDSGCGSNDDCGIRGFGSDGVPGLVTDFAFLGDFTTLSDVAVGTTDPALLPAPGASYAAPEGIEWAVSLSQLGFPSQIAFAVVTSGDGNSAPSPNTLPENPSDNFAPNQLLQSVACINEDGSPVTYVYFDNDLDGFGDPDSQMCGTPLFGFVANSNDCDDGEILNNPNGTEVCDDNEDNDCDGDVDGADADCIFAAAPGDVVISEFFADADVSDVDKEWFEVHNSTGSDIDLDGWSISDDGTDLHTISGPTVVTAGGYLVLGWSDNSALNGGAPVDYAYGPAFELEDGVDELVLKEPAGLEIDRVDYDVASWPLVQGQATQLDNAELSGDNTLPANWCSASLDDVYGPSGYVGSPGLPNSVCGCLNLLDDDGDGWVDLLDPECESGLEELGVNSGDACNDGADNDGDGAVDAADVDCVEGTDGYELTSRTWTEIHTDIILPSCSCHFNAHSTNHENVFDIASALTTWTTAVSSQVPQLELLDPNGDPDQSYIIQKLEGTAAVGQQMPRGGPFLAQPEIDSIRAWIDEGMRDN